jgi:septum formation protein
MLGLSFRVVPADVPEDLLDGESPQTHVERLSREKAARVREDYPDALVVAGDTIVVLEGEVLGKPEDQDAALRMLMMLQSRTHTVMSGIAVASPGEEIHSAVECTDVTFRDFDEERARAYVATGEPLDKAGAYGIQGLGASLVRGVTGDYFTVVGLPVPALLRVLESAGWGYAFGALYPTVQDSQS